MAKKTCALAAKECIYTALILLMQKKEYDRISIVDIVRKAGVSRMTYYRHFTSKEDVLEKYMDEVGQRVHDSIIEQNAQADFYTYFCVIFEQLSAYGDIGVAACRARLGEMILSAITKYTFETFPPDPAAPSSIYARHFLAGAIYNTLIEWLKAGQTLPYTEVAKVCCACMTGIALREDTQS
ncbi:MAG: TetR/AcrR family transcriptional regulator [Clostridia bacterium]|nr:TetR/AcrR family transcriptional regulator [Clostridia bacterium]MBO7150422.1 TetR/AcrR family transcriptional regulator [Clostridia bacterium]